MKSEIVKVHNTKIECPYEKDQHYVAVRSICHALGIGHQKQFDRIKNDEILKHVYTDTVYTSDTKGRKQPMFCIPLKYVFGWIFTIEAGKINARAKEAFKKYKMECYNALYEHFYLRTALYEKKEQMVADKKLMIVQAEQERSIAAERVKSLKHELLELENLPVNQLTLTFPQLN